MKSDYYGNNLLDNPGRRINGLNWAIKQALNRMSAESKKSREELLDEVNQLAEEAGVSLCSGNGTLSIATLNKWLDPNAVGHVPSIVATVSLCQVMGNHRALEPILSALGLEAMGPNDRRYRDLGKITEEMKTLRKKKRQIEDLI